MTNKDVSVTREISGMSALVTGSGSGIGRATALGLAHAGAAVVVCDLDLDAAVSVTNEIRKAGNEEVPCRADVRFAADQLAVLALAKLRFGGLHIAVNNAGTGSTAAPVADIDPDFWYRMIDTNLTGAFLGCVRRYRRSWRLAAVRSSTWPPLLDPLVGPVLAPMSLRNTAW